MTKKGFSLIEIIFSIMIISIVSALALTKFDIGLNKANLTQIKSDILQIRTGIYKYKNELILQNRLNSFNSLDENDSELFSVILNKPIIATAQNKFGSWSKVSDTEYKVFKNATLFALFTFNSNDYTFSCDAQNDLCKELDL